MKTIIKAKIINTSRVAPQNAGYRGQGQGQKNAFEDRYWIVLSPDAVRWIGFKEVRVNLRDLTINRASTVGYSNKRIANNRISIPIEEDLVGDYELIKINEDCFQLVKP